MRGSKWIVGGVLLTVSMHGLAADACSARSGATTVPLVELYTSEGCSSCPPADRWLSRVYEKQDANFLAFHVDYWDRLGWPDRFASPTNSQRQRQRVNAAGERTVYTPQVMVGTQIQTVWRTDADFSRALNRERQMAGVELALTVNAADGNTVSVEAKRLAAITDRSVHIWLAQYSDGEETKVGAGENGGSTLRHDRVVRKLWGPWALGNAALSESITLVSSGRSASGVTAFAQDASGRVWQSLSLPTANCKTR